MMRFYRFLRCRPSASLASHARHLRDRTATRDIMTNTDVAPIPTPADPDLITQFLSAATAVISDNLARLPGAVGLRPFHRGGTMVGTALTVRTAAGDNLAIHQALELVRPGDVLIVDGGGDTARALIGEIMSEIARMRRAAGMVIDGAVRDAGVLLNAAFP